MDNSESPERGYSVGASILLGLVMFFVYELVKNVVSEKLAVLGVVTISLAWAVVSTLRQYWHRKGFWWLLAGLFILHMSYMWAVYNYLTNLNVKTGLVIILAEVAVIFLTIFAIFGTKSLMSRS